MVAAIRPPRVESPERWHAALARAAAEGIQVRQLHGCGAWIATSGTDATAAYELEVTGNVCHACTCPAGSFGDLCKHRAAFYRLVGALDLAPPAPVARLVRCTECLGAGYIKVRTGDRFSDWVPGSCHTCNGTGDMLDPIAA